MGYKTATLSTYDVCLILMTDHMRKMLNQCGDTLVYLTSMTIPKIKYYVTFLFVLDEFYTPFPVFLMVSNKINNPQLNVMLESLRADMKAHKINLESKIFMTDRNPSAFTMWKDLIYAKSKHMVCPRYIDNEWRKYLATIFHEDTQDEIYDQLCELLEPKDHDAHALLSKVLAKLESNTMCSKFLTYFNKFYTTCFDEWGGHMLKEIINIHSVPNFEKILTEIQETLDAKYKKYSRNVVKILQMLFKRIISYQYARTTALAAIRTATEHNHRTALSTDLKKVYRTENEDEWRVVLDSKEIVKKNKYLPKCCRSDDVECSILCEQCAICVHDYVCTCHVYTVQNIVCVHIHLVARMMTHTLLSDVLEKNKAVLNQFDPPTIPSEVATPSEPEPSTQVEGEVALRKAIIQSLNNTQDKLYLIQDENKLRALFNIAEELHSLTCEMYNKDKTSTKTKIKAPKPPVIKKSAKSVITNDKGVVKNKNKPEQKQFVNIDVINVEPGMVPQIKTNETTNEKVIYVPSQNIQIVLDENRNPDENISENTNRRNSKNLNEIANVDEKQTTPCPETLVVAPAPRFNAPEKVIETQNTKKKPLNKTNTSHDVPDHIGKLDDVPTFHIHKKNKTETKDFAQSNKPEQVKRNKSETVEPNKQEVVKPSKPKVAETIKPNELNKSDTNTCEKNSSGSCPTLSTTDNIASKLIVQTSGTNNVSATTIASWDIELSWQNKKILIPLHKDPKAGIEKIIQKVNAGHFVYKNEKDKRGDIISANKPSIINQLSVILKLLHNPDDKVVAKPEGPVTVKLLEHREPLTLKRKIEEFSQQNYLKKENEGLVMSKTNENIPKKTEPLPMKGKIAENVSENICQTRPNAKEIVQCRQTQIPNRSQRAVEPSSKETGSYGENTKETSEPEIETLLPSKKGTKYVSETKALSPVEKTNTFQSAEVLPPPEKITKVESESPSEQVVIHTSDEALPPPDKVIKLECSEYNAADLGDRVSSSPDQQTEVERTIPKRVVRTLRPEIQNKFNSPHTKGCLKVLKPCIR